MRQSIGFLDEEHPTHVYLLKRSLYRLKQASRMWFHRLKEFLVVKDFNATQLDASLFVKLHEERSIYILVYVDDMVITGSNEEKVNQCLRELSLEFDVRIVGKLNYFLGIRVRNHADMQIVSRPATLSCKFAK